MQYFAFEYLGVTAMEYLHLLPSLEVLLFNLITLNHCLKRKYTMLKTVIILFCVVIVFSVLPGLFIKTDMFDGSGKFSVFGFIYIIPLKFLYDENLERIFLSMCMSWTYTLGILAISMQAMFFLLTLGYDVQLIIIETALFAVTFVPFRKYAIPKYTYIFGNLYDFQKKQFRYLEVTIYFIFFMLLILHAIFLDSEEYLLQITVLMIVLVTNYLFCSIVYEVINGSLKISELEKTVSNDALTGLENRVQMMRHMGVLIEKNRVFSIMFLDLDGFKFINDRYGHDVGDRYLIHFGKVYSEELKEKGKLYRYGGDEFVAIYYGILTEETAASIARCEKWDVGAPCEFNQVSFGFVVCKPPYTDKDPRVILKRADSIMYKNKLNRKKENLS